VAVSAESARRLSRFEANCLFNGNREFCCKHQGNRRPVAGKNCYLFCLAAFSGGPLLLDLLRPDKDSASGQSARLSE